MNLRGIDTGVDGERERQKDDMREMGYIKKAHIKKFKSEVISRGYLNFWSHTDWV